MRDENSLPPLDLVILTAVRTLVAKRSCFHDTGARARDLRGLTNEKDDAFDLTKVVPVKAITERMMWVASPRIRDTIPELKSSVLKDSFTRLVGEGWLVPVADGFKYQHTPAAPAPEAA